ncbi:MAG: DUF5658 family protein [Thermofilaceae archaeon]
MLIFGGLVDHVSTLLLLRKHPLECELNPIIKWVYEGWGEKGILGTYIISTLMALALLFIFREVKIFNEIVFLLGAIRLAVGIWNTALLVSG